MRHSKFHATIALLGILLLTRCTTTYFLSASGSDLSYRVPDNRQVWESTYDLPPEQVITLFVSAAARWHFDPPSKPDNLTLLTGTQFKIKRDWFLSFLTSYEEQLVISVKLQPTRPGVTHVVVVGSANERETDAFRPWLPAPSFSNVHDRFFGFIAALDENAREYQNAHRAK